MKIEEFEHALKEDDFGVGESFWIGDWEFEVVNTTAAGKITRDDDLVFRWELNRQEFVQVIADSHPEIEDPEGFFKRHQDEIIHCFAKGFDTLVSGCGATYGSVMNDAIDEAVDEAGVPGRQRVARHDSEGSDSRPLSEHSKICKEVNETMENDTQQRVDAYIALFDGISEKVNSDVVAIAILQEVSKDRRSGEIRTERATQSAGPATEKQKQFMKKLNIRFPANVTKHEASTMIDEELAKNGE